MINAPDTPTSSTMMQLVEHYHCPACDGAIAGDAVFGRLLPHTLRGTRRAVAIFCEHCDFAWKTVLQLDAVGHWQQAEPVNECTRKERDAVVARMNKLRNHQVREIEKALAADH